MEILKNHGIISDPISEVENYNFEYLGKKKMDGRDTIVIKCVYLNDKDIFKEGFVKVYIDMETGIVVGNSGFVRLGVFYKRYKENITVKFNCVTDEDVARPNISGYVVQDFRNQEE